MKYCTTVIAVRDMEKSLQFYKDLFQQDVLVDFGKRISGKYNNFHGSGRARCSDIWNHVNCTQG